MGFLNVVGPVKLIITQRVLIQHRSYTRNCHIFHFNTEQNLAPILQIKHHSLALLLEMLQIFSYLTNHNSDFKSLFFQLG